MSSSLDPFVNSTDFFLIVAPGLESLAESELIEKWSLLQLKFPEVFSGSLSSQKVRGGLQVALLPHQGWLLNHYLKIPTRILQRIDRFSAKDFPKLFHKIQRLPWHLYLRAGPVDIRVSVSASRLKIKDRLKETTLKAIQESQKHNAFRKAFLDLPQTVFIRVHENDVTISLDTSGEFLHLRGYKKYGVQAPVRETLGAALYYFCTTSVGMDSTQVSDSMCGSGTLLFESLSFWKAIRSRHFAYENFPISATHPKVDLKKDIREGAVSGIGMDRDSKAIEASRLNFEIYKKFYAGPIEVFSGDSFIETPDGLSPSQLLLMNPPYNERLSAQRDVLIQGIEATLRHWRPSELGLLWPGEKAPKLQRVTWRSEIATSNGGIPVVMASGAVLSSQR